MNRGCRNSQRFSGLVRTNGEKSVRVDGGGSRVRTFHFPCDCRVRIIVAGDCGSEPLCSALFYCHRSRGNRNGGHRRSTGVRLKGNVYFIGLRLCADDCRYSGVVHTIALRYALAFERIGAKLYCCSSAGGCCHDFSNACAGGVVNAIGHIRQAFAGNIKGDQLNGSGRLRKLRGVNRVFVRNQLAGTFYLQSQRPARTDNFYSVDGNRGFTFRHRLRHFRPCLGTGFVGIYHVARSEIVYRHRCINIAAVRRGSRTRLRVFDKRHIGCRSRFFSSFRLKRCALLNTLRRADRRRCVVDTSGLSRAEVEICQRNGCPGCRCRTDFRVGIARFCVDLNGLADRHMCQRKRIGCARIVLRIGKMHHNRIGLRELVGLEHLPFINADTAPRRRTIVVNHEFPFRRGNRFV